MTLYEYYIKFGEKDGFVQFDWFYKGDVPYIKIIVIDPSYENKDRVYEMRVSYAQKIAADDFFKGVV